MRSGWKIKMYLWFSVKHMQNGVRDGLTAKSEIEKRP